MQHDSPRVGGTRIVAAPAADVHERRRSLFLDESGDTVPCPSSSAETCRRFMGLVGVAFRPVDLVLLDGDLRQLKRAHFGREDLVLHRVDILHARRGFGRLADAGRREAFDRDLLALIEAAPFRVFAVVVDKAAPLVTTPSDPYALSLRAVIEMYGGWLRHTNCVGDVTVEQRGKQEDRKMRKVYEETWAQGSLTLTARMAQERLTSKQLKLQPKQANVAALQLADLLAHPITRFVLKQNGLVDHCGGPFGDRLTDIAYLKKFDVPNAKGEATEQWRFVA